MGKITKWNDKEIAAINPDLKLPGLAVATVHRADGSGTTFVFTDYLSACKALSGKARLAPPPASVGRQARARREATVSLAPCGNIPRRHRLR